MPIGLMYIASYIRKHGHEVIIVDSKYDDIFAKIKEFHPEIIGIGAMTVMAPEAIHLARLIRKGTDALIVFGGVHFTFLPDDAKDIADIIVKGEGEKTFCQLCDRVPLRHIPGIMYKERGEWIDNGQYEFIENLDELPIPAYDLIDITRYNDELVTGEKAFSIMAGRGCPYNCLFCASPKLWRRRMRSHSINYVIKHIQFLVDTYDIHCLRIMDDTFTVDKRRVMLFCDAIEKAKIHLKMACLTNVLNADYEMFVRMKAVGFDFVAFGIESANKTVLANVNKAGNTEKNTRSAVDAAHRAGLRTELLFMVGNIGETDASLDESVQFSKELNGDKVYFQYATPFPGSEFYDVADQYGVVKDRDWSKWNHKEIHYVPFGVSEEAMKKAVREGTNG